MEKEHRYNKVSSCCGKIVSYSKNGKPKVCPFCGDAYWDKPKDERDLFYLQKTYIENGRTRQDLGKMYPAVFKYSMNIIKSAIRNKIIYSEDDLIDKTEKLAVMFLEKYMKNKDFVIDYSFGGLMIKMSNGVLFNNKVKRQDQVLSLEAKHHDSNVSIINNLNFFLTDSTIRKNYESNAYDEYESNNSIEIVDELNYVISEIYKRLKKSYSPGNCLLFLIGLKNFFQNDKNFKMEEFYVAFGNTIRRDIENTKLVIREYLLNNIRNQ